MKKMVCRSVVTALAVAMLLVAGTASAVPTCANGSSYLYTPLTPMPPSVGNFDFCLAMNTIYCSLSPVATTLGITSYLPLFACDLADINGPLDLAASIPVTANGMLDSEYELGLVGAILNNASYSQNGLTQAEVLAGFQANYTLFSTTIDAALAAAGYTGLINALAPYLPKGLAYSLAGYALLGDTDTIGAISAIFGLLADLGITPPDVSQLVGFPTQLAKLGDADGDGCTNFAEYTAYSSSGAATYIANALNPAVNPGNCSAEGEGEGEGEGEPAGADSCGLTVNSNISITGPNWAEVNGAVELRCAFGTTPAGTLSYQWKKDCVDITDATGSSYKLDSVALTDGGEYRVAVTDGAKATTISSLFVLSVYPAGSLPLTGGLGLALLAGASALAGVVGIRRKK